MVRVHTCPKQIARVARVVSVAFVRERRRWPDASFHHIALSRAASRHRSAWFF
jgi:hypothetical protein